MAQYQSSLIVSIYRGIRLVLHLLYGLLIAATILSFFKPEKRDKIISYWSRGLVGIFNIRLIVQGNRPTWHSRGILFIANHISWFDIFALNSVRTIRFIAKLDIRGWPVLGWFVEKGNTLFIDRSKRSEATRMVEITAKALENGDLLAFFPEGTTTDGTHLLPFKASLIQAAINTQTTVWPVAIQYLNAEGKIDINMGYYGDISLAGSMLKMLQIRQPTMILSYLEPLSFTSDISRTDLAELAKSQIKKQLAIAEKII